MVQSINYVLICTLLINSKFYNIQCHIDNCSIKVKLTSRVYPGVLSVLDFVAAVVAT